MACSNYYRSCSHHQKQEGAIIMLSDASGCRDDMGRYWLIFIIEMLGRFARLLTKALPLTALAISSGFTLVIPRMTSPSPFTSSLPSFTHSSHPRIKFVRDLAAYVDRLLVRDRAVILFQLTGDSFIDEQVVRLAEDFLKGHAGEVSSDFEFIFLEERHGLTEEKDQEHYFILYGPNGERVINIDPYLNKNRQRPHVLPNRKPLHRRLVESVNIYREVGLENIANQLAAIENDPNYVALVANAAQDYQTTSAKGKLKAFEKNHQVKAKNLSKFIVKDQHVGKVLGVKKEGVFLLVADSDNLRKDFREKAQFFSISGKRVTAVHASTAVLEDIFIFPPVQKSLSPSQYVLNVYVNRNNSSEKLQSEIKAELSKEEYRKYPKALYYSSDVEQAAIYYQKNDYSSECLQAYQPNTTLPKDAIRNLLTNTFQYEYLLNNKSINSHHLQQWLKQCEEDKAEQHFPSEKPSEAWAQQITGEEYKTILQHPTDKVIYHYSHHCHGCKKFGGKFQQFAKARRHPIDFYRINNDNNKAEGVRNYNSTPVFVFYKQGSLHPFIYKMPIFTEQVFDSFLTITSQLKLIRPDSFEKHIQTRSAASDLVGKMLREQFGGQSSL